MFVNFFERVGPGLGRQCHGHGHGHGIFIVHSSSGPICYAFYAWCLRQDTTALLINMTVTVTVLLVQ
jgi:hypothetical protein